MPWGKAVLEGRLEGPLPGDFLERLATRARDGRFGAQRKRYDVETVVDEGGYRTATTTQSIHLRAQGEGPPHVLDDLTLERAGDGALIWRVDMARLRGRRLAFAAALVLGAGALGIARLGTAHSLPLLLPVFLVAFFSIWSGGRKAEATARGAVVAALRAELDDERIDESLTGVGENAALGRAIVERLEARAIPLTEDERARVLECDERALLEQWRANAEKCTTAGELFEGLRVAATGPRIADADAGSDPTADADADSEADSRHQQS